MGAGLTHSHQFTKSLKFTESKQKMKQFVGLAVFLLAFAAAQASNLKGIIKTQISSADNYFESYSKTCFFSIWFHSHDKCQTQFAKVYALPLEKALPDDSDSTQQPMCFSSPYRFEWSNELNVFRTFWDRVSFLQLCVSFRSRGYGSKG